MVATITRPSSRRQEAFLVGVALLCAHARVVGQRVEAAQAKPFGGLVHLAP
jgi:hypothetical protein